MQLKEHASIVIQKNHTSAYFTTNARHARRDINLTLMTMHARTRMEFQLNPVQRLKRVWQTCLLDKKKCNLMIRIVFIKYHL